MDVVKRKISCLMNCPTSSSQRVYGLQHTCLVFNRVAGYKSYLVKLSFPRLLIRSASAVNKAMSSWWSVPSYIYLAEAEEIFICSI